MSSSNNIARSNRSVRSPCIGICSTTYGDTVCRGCNRFYHEVVNWNGYSNDQKQLICSRIDEINTKIISKYVLIHHRDQLKSELKKQAIRFDPKRSVWSWVYALLSLVEKRGLELEAFGLEPKAEFKDICAGALATTIQEAIYELTQAYFDRQIDRAKRHRDLQSAPL